MFSFRRNAYACVLLAATALAAGLSAAPARAADGDQVTISFANWAAAEGATRPGIEQAIAEFEKQNPGIKVESQAISFSEIARQLVLRIRSGNPPDIAEVAGNDTFLLAMTGRLEPLGAYLDEDLKAQIKPSSLSGFEIEGKLIAFPWTQAPAGFWYNKAVMEKAGLDPQSPPRTIDALMEAMAAVKESQPDVIPLGMDTTNRAFSLISNWPWMQTFGANPIEDPQSDAMKAYLTWMRDLAQKGYIDPGRKIGEFRPLIAQDKVAFHWDQVLLQGVIQTTNGMSDEEFNAHYSVMKQPTGPSGKSFSFEGGHELVLFADSKQKEAAWKFMQFLATSPYAIENYTISYESSLMPLAKAPNDDLAAKLDTPVFNAFLNDIMPTVTTPPYGPDFAAAATAIMAGVQQAVTGSMPIDDIAASINQNLGRQ